MPATFPGDTKHAVLVGLGKLRDRMCRIYEHRIDPMEVVRALVSPSDMEVLRQAAVLGLNSGSYGNNVAFKFRDVFLTVDLRSTQLPLPRYFGEGSQTLRPEYPFFESATDYIGNVRDVVTRFASARAAIEVMDDLCGTLRQVRYYLPALPTLLKIGGAEKAAASVLDPPRLRNSPDLPVYLLDAVAEVNALVARAVLLPEATKRDTTIHVSFDPVPIPWYPGKHISVSNVYG